MPEYHKPIRKQLQLTLLYTLWTIHTNEEFERTSSIRRARDCFEIFGLLLNAHDGREEKNLFKKLTVAGLSTEVEAFNQQHGDLEDGISEIEKLFEEETKDVMKLFHLLSELLNLLNTHFLHEELVVCNWWLKSNI